MGEGSSTAAERTAAAYRAWWEHLPLRDYGDHRVNTGSPEAVAA